MKPLFPEVRVNGAVIPHRLIAAEAQNHPAPRGKPGAAWQAAARALVVRALLLEAARAAGITEAPAALGDGREESGEDSLIRQYLERVLDPAPVEEADCRAAYAAAPGRFRAPDLFEVSHILIAADPGNAEARARARSRAEALLARLSQKPHRFAALAKEMSDCSSAAQGGMLGQLGPGDSVPEFEAAMQALTPGEIADRPVETRFGFHILRLDRRAEGAPLPFEAVAPRLRAALEKAAWARAANALVAGLVAAAEIEGVDMTAAKNPRAA